MNKVIWYIWPQVSPEWIVHVDLDLESLNRILDAQDSATVQVLDANPSWKKFDNFPYFLLWKETKATTA